MDKISILNDALRVTGNNQVNVLNDPSDEYIVANGAFERALRMLVSQHTWPFATTNELLTRAPDEDNKSRRYPRNGFWLPENTLHVKEVFWDTTFLTAYEIMGRVLSCDYDSQIYATVVKQVSEEQLHPMAEEILTLYVEAGILRGLNEDYAQAQSRENRADGLLQITRPYVDQQNPARNIFKSSIAAARRRRRG